MSTSISVVVVDDEALARTRLERFLKSIPNTNLVGLGENGEQAFELTKRHQPDVLLIDIQMPKLNGLDAAKKIVEHFDQPPAIIFCTAYDQYAIEAFSSLAVGYLLKPITYDDLNSAILKAQRLSRLQIQRVAEGMGEQKKITVAQSGYLAKLPVSEVLYFRSEGKSVVAGLVDQHEVIIDYTLKVLEESLNNDFLRIHRSTLVNVNKFERFYDSDDGGKMLKLIGYEQPFLVSRRHLKQVKSYFS